MSNNLDPVQARRSVGPDLGPNCLQMLSALVVKELIKQKYWKYNQYLGVSFCIV